MNFGELKSAMGDWLAKDEDNLPSTVRGQIVNMVIREYIRKFDLRFGETIASVNAIASQAYSTLPTGFSRPFSMCYLDSNNNRIDVDFLTKEEYDIKYPDPTVAGDIVHYTIWAGKIWWGPTPSDNRTTVFNCFCYLADLADPTDHNDFTDLAWELVLFRSLCRSSQYGIEDARIAVWDGAAKEIESQLDIEHSRCRTAGRRPVSREYGYTGK